MLRHFFALLVAFMMAYPGVVGAVEFTEKQVGSYPCLKKVQLPAFAKTAKSEDVPEKYRSWVGTTSVLVGEWKGTRIGDFCQVVLIEKMDENGFSQVWYSASPRGMYDGFKRYMATVKEADGHQVLEFQFPGSDISISYSLKSGENRADSLYLPSQAKGYVQVVD